MHRFRFDGIAPEPRKGINSGHVPGSKCIPFPQVGICSLKKKKRSFQYSMAVLFHLLYKTFPAFNEDMTKYFHLNRLNYLSHISAVHLMLLDHGELTSNHWYHLDYRVHDIISFSHRQ